MREIKFRGKRTDSGEWVYGYLALHDYIADGQTHYQVDPETVGQYTGLKDKNGVDIYEGDMLKQIDSFEGVVRYDYGSWEVFLPDMPECYDPLNSCYDFEEVIGNIHDNPELVEEA